ncbi:DNA-binding transcriptional regulator, LysR family [Geodermatophilus africanus]|uniref:DNA-binding transcriptional regulator, LysR family n=1 Tax=Geodermatophilus africanus TaxID=1137993 RepID=A0A1H3QWD0_9ACTN|nr:LysR family transcriptional regulator [Geodermatophilus africanus]SDZ17009.1 DNA-binding transcriptional regulator, LysR family [Geodermatophilus africanus]
MLNPLHLRTLTAVLQTGSFAVAARRLGYTPSAVSQQIAALERAAGLPLFEREAHGIRPTPAAAWLRGRGQEVLAALGALQDDLRGLADGATGTVRLGSFPTASEHLLPSALAALAAGSPSVEVLLDEGEPGELVPRVHDGDLDVALVYRYTRVPVRRPRALALTPLLREDLVLLLPPGHRSAGEEEVRLGDLADAPWITTRQGTAGATCLQRVCAEAGFEPRVGYRSNDYDVLRGFVRAGLGVALVPVLGSVPDPGVATARLAGVDVHRHVGVLTRPGLGNPAVAGVVAALTAAAADRHDPERGVCREPALPATPPRFSPGPGRSR